jgi:hypothetical protein
MVFQRALHYCGKRRARITGWSMLRRKMCGLLGHVRHSNDGLLWLTSLWLLAFFAIFAPGSLSLGYLVARRLNQRQKCQAPVGNEDGDFAARDTTRTDPRARRFEVISRVRAVRLVVSVGGWSLIPPVVDHVCFCDRGARLSGVLEVFCSSERPAAAFGCGTSSHHPSPNFHSDNYSNSNWNNQSTQTQGRRWKIGEGWETPSR